MRRLDSYLLGVAVPVLACPPTLMAWPAAGPAVAVVALAVAVAASLVHAVTAVRSRAGGRRAWVLAGCASACWAAGQASAFIDLGSQKATAVPSATALNLAAAALAIGSCFAAQVPASGFARVRMLLDGVVAASSLFAVMWIIGLSGVTASAGGTAEMVLYLVYAMTALGGLAAGLLLVGAQERTGINSITLLTGGLITISATALADVYAVGAGHSAAVEPWLTGGRLLSAVLLGAAPLAHRAGGTYRLGESARAVGRCLPYLPLGVLMALGVVQTVLGEPLQPPVIFAGILMLGGVLARQFLALRANARLTADLEQQRNQLAHQAFHDQLTGLPNRAMLADRLGRIDADRPVSGTALLMLDLDGFKAVNDTLGHAAGDELLTIVAGRLAATQADIAGDGLTARLGGDEFAVLLSTGDRDTVVELAQRLLGALSAPVRLSTHTVHVGGSIGVAILGEPAQDSQQLICHADLALYAAKGRGKGRYQLFDATMSADLAGRLQLQAELAAAVDNDELDVAYQPIVDLHTNAVTGTEALLRWRHPTRGILTPGAFLPAAEAAGLLARFDRWILNRACEQTQQWRRTHPELTISVNISAAYLLSGDLHRDVTEALARTGLPAHALTVELTETTLVANLDAAAYTLTRLRQLGVRIALDDFGVGYSSLNYLRTLPVDTIKIDRAFINDLTAEGTDAAVVNAVLALARSLNLNHVAEGVEVADQAHRLQELLCPQAQGYFFAHPMDAASTEKELAARRPTTRNTATTRPTLTTVTAPAA